MSQYEETYTWDEIEENPQFLERGPISAPKDGPFGFREPFITILVGNVPVAVIGTENAYEAVSLVQNLKEPAFTHVLINGEVVIVEGAERVIDAINQALEAVKSKRKRTVKKEPPQEEPQQEPRW